MADTLTPFLGLTKPVVGDEAGEDLWGEKLNANFDKLDIFASQQGTLTEAPNDGLIYGRQNAAWTETIEKASFDTLSTTVAGHTNDIAILDSTKVDDASATGLLYVRGGNAGDPNSMAWFNMATNGVVAWGNVLNKPATFPSDWNTTANTPSTFPSDWSTTANKPATFAPSPHQHAQSDITNLTSDQTAQNTQISTNASNIAALTTTVNGKEPALPAGGNTTNYLRGDKTWQVLPTGISDAPSDSGEYVRINGVWRLKAQSFTPDGLTTFDITVPATAKAVIVDGSLYQLTGTSAIFFQASMNGTTFLTTTADYRTSGPVGNTGTALYQAWGSGIADSGLRAADGSATANTFMPHIISGTINVAIPSSSVAFAAAFRSKTNDASAGNLYRAWFGSSYVTPASAGSNLRIQKLRLMAGVAFGTGSWLEVRWVY